ncbi:MAG: polysaccharide biosynthesis protein [Clostridiales Family XIII bacterium]|jgi:UDP-glucose 4-epimerase|nr:polysaccharide biosynthesis protein [Clostridiales Family XIII bacterium]
MKPVFQGKTLLITGGTGSFGNAVLRHFLDTGLKEARIFSRDEKKQDDMRKKYGHPKIKFYIGDVRNRDSIEMAMHGVDFVFHAAALKQVPSCEFFPLEAVATNIIGTDNVLTVAIQNSVKKVIVLSTDKAAYPINAMGMSKALMEKVAVAKSRDENSADTVICRTRYGNVMASRGSVIPLFANQIKAGGPLTITNGAMTRFMMTLDDAVELVAFAFLHGEKGDLFVQKAPAATIDTLAEAMMGKLGQSVSVKRIGERHGEKLYEVLVTKEEMLAAEDMGNFFRVRADNRGLLYEQYYTEGDAELDAIEEYNSHNTQRLDTAGMRKLLDKLDFGQLMV